MLQTDTQGQMNSTAMLKVWILEKFASIPASQSLCILHCH